MNVIPSISASHPFHFPYIRNLIIANALDICLLFLSVRMKSHKTNERCQQPNEYNENMQLIIQCKTFDEGSLVTKLPSLH